MQGKDVRKYTPFVLTLLVMVLTSPTLKGQDYDPNAKTSEDKGPTASELISGSSNSISGMLKFDTSVGWNFTKNFGVDVGVPYMFNTRPGIFAGTSGRLGYVNEPYVGCTYFFGCYTGVETSARIWAGELADGYVEAHYTRTYQKYNLLTNLTGDLPTASFRRGLTSGRMQWDWFNHIDTNLHGFDPFVNFGLANGRMDQHFLPRPFDTDLPFRTLGYSSDWEGGVQYKVWRRFTVGFSVWDVLPMGPQRIYSNIVWDQADESILALGAPNGGAGLVTTAPATSTGPTGDFRIYYRRSQSRPLLGLGIRDRRPRLHYS